MPEHHIHDSSEPLPGNRGANPAVDYSAGAMDRTPSSVWNDAAPTGQSHPEGRTAFNSERPLDVQPTAVGKYMLLPIPNFVF